MRRILHRINTKDQLINCPTQLGVEVDIRTFGDDFIIHHDPFVKGENLEEWLSAFNHGTLILNVKEEGLESRLINLMRDHSIDDYFFLDQSFPFLVKTAEMGERRCAVRVSEYESIDTAMSLAGKVDWVWVDCFTHFPLTKEDADKLQIEGGFKLCFVSPELQGRTEKGKVKIFRNEIDNLGIIGDAVCTKYPDLWA